MCDFQFHEMKRNLRPRRHIDTTRPAPGVRVRREGVSKIIHGSPFLHREGGQGVRLLAQGTCRKSSRYLISFHAAAEALVRADGSLAARVPQMQTRGGPAKTAATRVAAGRQVSLPMPRLRIDLRRDDRDAGADPIALSRGWPLPRTCRAFRRGRAARARGFPAPARFALATRSRPRPREMLP
jgi:hypothetical protein